MQYKINQKVIVNLDCYNFNLGKFIVKEYKGKIVKYVNLNLNNGKILYKVYIEKMEINTNIQEEQIKRITRNSIKKL